MTTVIILLLSVVTTWACNPISTIEQISTRGCDCSYQTGGCRISQAAPPLFACKCKLEGPFTCSGSKTQCKDLWSLKCLQPDSSLDSCVEGQGDCGGYDCKCGVPLATTSVGTKIIGGQNALPNEFPWQVLLTDANSAPQCSGILLSSRSILTTANCNGRQIETASVGVYNRTYPTADVQSFTIYTNSWSRHPDHSGNNLNFAIITLAGPVRFTPNVYPVCLPSPGSIYDNTESVVTGWGATGSADYSDILRKLTETTMSNADCEQLAAPTITENMICAAAANEGACWYDWGGPLITKNQTSGRYEVIGIATSEGCAGSTNSGADVYGRVTSVLPWIKTTIAGTTCS